MKQTKLFAPLSKMPFTTAGSNFTLSTTNGGNDSFGYGKLWLGNNHSGGRNRKSKFFRVQLTYKGRLIPCAYVSTPTELRMESDYGCVKFCYPEPHLLCFKGEGDVGLRIYGPMGPQHEACRDLLDGTYEICWSNMNNWLFVPISGKFHMDAPYNYVGTRSNYVSADYEKDGDTPFEGIIEESLLYARRRPSYPTYEQGLADSTARFKDFLDNTCPNSAGMPQEFRELAAWVTWTHIVYPNDVTRYKRTMIRSQQECLPFCMAWHQYYHACTFRNDKALVWDLLESLYEHILPNGQLPDSVADDYCQYNGCKPPIQGFTFNWLLDHSNVFEGENERLAALTEKFESNLNWWMTTHDLDHNGIPEYQHSDESGLDDSSAFKDPPVESPDLCAYLALSFEALARFKKILGDEAAYEKNMAQSKVFIDHLVNVMWNGEKFDVIAARDRSVIDSYSVMCYIPAILGERLPESIREKLVADLMNEEMFLSPYGIRSESISSFDFQGLWTLGAVIACIQFFAIIGIEACGHFDDAAEATRRYIEFQDKFGMDIGDCTDDRLWLHNLYCAWNASIALFLGTWFLK